MHQQINTRYTSTVKHTNHWEKVFCIPNTSLKHYIYSVIFAMAVFYFLLSTKIADHWWCHIGYPFLKTWIEWNHSALMAMFVFLVIQSVYYLLNIILVPASLYYDQCCQIKLVLFFVLYFQQWVLVPSLYFTVLSYSQISLPCIKFSLPTSPFPWQLVSVLYM